MFRYLLFIFYLAYSFYGIGQDFDSIEWVEFEDDDIQLYVISTNKTFQIDDFRFEIIWENKMVPNENLGYLGGIKEMKIYKEDILINTFKDIEDSIGLGEIYFRFYDYNMDGESDFTLPINYRWERYFLYDVHERKFKHQKSWDYLKIQKFNHEDKLILAQPVGMEGGDSRKLYFIKESQLIEINH